MRLIADTLRLFSVRFAHKAFTHTHILQSQLSKVNNEQTKQTENV